jgi:dTDP-glucose 4,6-dehydratase
MKLFVTGGAGFIGSHFIRCVLAQRADWRVVNLDKLTYAGNLENLTDLESHPRYRFVQGDIADIALVKRLFRDESFDTIVNFAAESHVDRSILDAAPFVQTNIRGTQVLLEVARKFSLKRFIQISTDEVYGSIGVGGFHEDSSLSPNSPYAASKAAADLLSLSYHRTYGLPVIVTRSSNNYGPHQFPEKLIPLMIRNAVQGQKLPVYGKGQNVRDWLYVEDNCKAIASVIDQGQVGSVYNIGAGEERPNLEVVELICELLAIRLNKPAGELKELIEFVKDRPGHDFRYGLDSRRIRTELGWEPTVGLEEGLARTIDWYLCHQEWVNNVVSGEYKQYYHRVYEKGWQ